MTPSSPADRRGWLSLTVTTLFSRAGESRKNDLHWLRYVTPTLAFNLLVAGHETTAGLLARAREGWWLCWPRVARTADMLSRAPRVRRR